MAEAWEAHVRGWLELTSEVRRAPTTPSATSSSRRSPGAWPIEPERLDGYLEKALREAKRTTSWIEPDEEHEAAVKAYARGLIELPEFRADFDPFVAELAAAGERAALGQLLLKLTVPGLPDIYNGDELPLLSLVDPDNRRPVDWERAARGARRAAPRRGRRPEAAADRARARAARAAAGGVRRRLRAGRGGRRTSSRSRAARGRCWSSCRCARPRASRSSCPTTSRARGATC